ncbi:MAG: hypothetical protein ACI9UQ_001528 [Candidatus Krumholzibacteriia bacterium]|jgi:hypothetical protein
MPSRLNFIVGGDTLPVPQEGSGIFFYIMGLCSDILKIARRGKFGDLLGARRGQKCTYGNISYHFVAIVWYYSGWIWVGDTTWPIREKLADWSDSTN